jgi:hypothetical protein
MRKGQITINRNVWFCDCVATQVTYECVIVWPRRFLEHPEVNPLSGHDDFQLVPFGVGRRMCPGARLAYSLVSLMLANLLHSFDWSLPEGQSADGLDMQEAVSFILYKDKRLCLNAKPRSPASLY